MANIENREIPYEVLFAAGLIKNGVILRSSGRSADTAVGAINDVWPILGTLVHQTVASPIDIVSDSVNDTAAGTGARTLLVTGLDPNFDAISEAINLNGLTPVQTVNSYIRHHSTIVIASGTYMQTATPVHDGDISLSFSGTADTAGLITDFDGVSNFTTSACHRTVPRGFTGFVRTINISTDQNSSSTISILLRQNANIVTAPFSGGGLVAEIESLEGSGNFILPSPFPIAEMSDVWFTHVPNSNNTVAACTFVIELYAI